MQKRFLIVVLLVLAFPLHARAENIVITPPPKAQCDLLIRNLADELKVGNYCRDDSECMKVTLGCPLPCNALVNVNEPAARIEELKSGYDHLCGACKKDCAEPQGTAACVEHKCVYR